MQTHRLAVGMALAALAGCGPLEAGQQPGLPASSASSSFGSPADTPAPEASTGAAADTEGPSAAGASFTGATAAVTSCPHPTATFARGTDRTVIEVTWQDNCGN